MLYLITGGTGLIGALICKKLLAAGHQVCVLTRGRKTAQAKLADQVELIESLAEFKAERKLDVVINLAGAPIADARWTIKRKHLLESSRIDLTQQLVNWLDARTQKPQCLISGSAVGWYGDGGQVQLTENSQANTDYAHELCARWEQAALAAESHAIRVCIVRTGLVLSANGGMMQRLKRPFKLGLGGRLGNGRQFMPWIHEQDIADLFIFLSQQPQCSGVFNGTAPDPVSNAVFTASLAEVVNRPAFLHMPACILKLILGEMASLLLSGQNAVPEKARAAGFNFTYTDIKTALKHVV